MKTQKIKKGSSSKEKKLSIEIAKVVSMVLAVIFICMNAISIFMSRSALTGAIDGEFEGGAKLAQAQVENILVSAQTAATGITDYLQKAYQLSAEGKTSMSGEQSGEMAVSAVYGQQITQLSKDVEEYITESVRHTAKNNPDIVGMTVLFEPYAFDKNIKDYAFYVLGTESDKEIVPYGNYEDYSVQEYYAKAAASGEPEFTEPYDDQGIKMVTYSVPIIYDNELKGVITTDINVTNFAKVFSKNDRYPSKYVTVISDSETVVYDSDSDDNVGAHLADFIAPQYYEKIRKRMEENQMFTIEIKREDGVSESCYYSPITLGNNTWWALSALQTSDKNEDIQRTLWVLVILTVVSLAAVTWIVFYFLRKMLHPINAVVEAAERISEGNLEIDLKSESNDEIGKLAVSFQKTVDVLRSIIDDVSYLLENMANGNFNIATRVEEQYKGNFRPMLISLNDINVKLSDTLKQISESTVQVSSASEQMARAAQNLAEGSTEQAGEVEELLATINDVKTQVEKSAEDASEASSKANVVGSFAKESNDQMEQMTLAMNKISDTSTEIGSIIKTIESIASQTNLLSLNAAIEAARAGEAGKGFAVVAEEIRELATQSQKAANNTKQLIESAISEVETGNQITEATAVSLNKVTDGIVEIIKIVETVETSSKQQANSTEQIAQGIEQFSEVVQSNSATAEETSATSEELSAQAEELNNLVSAFELKK